MMTSKLIYLLMTVFFVVDVASGGTWKDKLGREISADFFGVDGDKVIFVFANGRKVSVPLEKLADEDQRRVAALTKGADSQTRWDSGILRGDGPKAERTWPVKVEIEGTPTVDVVKEDAGSKQFIYRSEHYEFQSDIRLSKSVVREFARIFEATYLLNCKLPLDLAPHVEGGQKLFEAHIFETREAYMEAGGLPGSGGVYMSSMKKFLVPIESLGVVNRGSRVTIDYDMRDFSTLIHEITHQMMNQWLGYLPVWYVEGSAVYAEMLKYRNGKFDLSNLKSTIRDHVGGRDVKMLDPEVLLGMDYETWTKALEENRSKVNYVSAGLLAVYFYHIDGEGDAAGIIQCLRNVEAGRKSWAESQKEILVRGRTMDEFRKELKVGFKLKMNLDVEFVRE